jgi:hypothetical protein
VDWGKFSNTPIEQLPHERWFMNRNSLCDSANYTNCYHGYRSSENAQRLLQLLSPSRPHRLGRSLCCLSSSLRLSGPQARPRVRTWQAAWESDVGKGSSRMFSAAVTNARSACLDGIIFGSTYSSKVNPIDLRSYPWLGSILLRKAELPIHLVFSLGTCQLVKQAEKLSKIDF